MKRTFNLNFIRQNGIAWVTDAIKYISNTHAATNPGTHSHIGIPLASSASVGLMLWLARG